MKTMKKYYITYEKKNPSVIWGTGTKKTTSHKDALRWLNQYDSSYGELDHSYKTELETIEVSKALYDQILQEGGENVEWKRKNGMGILV